MTAASKQVKAPRGRRAALRALIAGAVAATIILTAGWLGGLRLNLTPSAPLGLWWIAPLRRPAMVGDRVFVCPPHEVSVLGRARGYLQAGLCPSGVAPLIKIVAAVSGQRVEIGSTVVIDGAPLPNSNLHATDGEGRPLASWPGGIVPAGQLFLYSAFKASYDSRYFGPLPISGLLGLARPIFTVDP